MPPLTRNDKAVSCATASGHLAYYHSFAGFPMCVLNHWVICERQSTKTETILSIEGWSKRSVAESFELNASFNARCSSVAPKESMPAAISGESPATCEPSTSAIKTLTCYITLTLLSLSVVVIATGRSSPAESFGGSLCHGIRLMTEPAKSNTSKAEWAVSRVHSFATSVYEKELHA